MDTEVTNLVVLDDVEHESENTQGGQYIREVEHIKENITPNNISNNGKVDEMMTDNIWKTSSLDSYEDKSHKDKQVLNDFSPKNALVIVDEDGVERSECVLDGGIRGVDVVDGVWKKMVNSKDRKVVDHKKTEGVVENDYNDSIKEEMIQKRKLEDNIELIGPSEEEVQALKEAMGFYNFDSSKIPFNEDHPYVSDGKGGGGFLVYEDGEVFIKESRSDNRGSSRPFRGGRGGQRQTRNNSSSFQRSGERRPRQRDGGFHSNRGGRSHEGGDRQTSRRHEGDLDCRRHYKDEYPRRKEQDRGRRRDDRDEYFGDRRGREEVGKRRRDEDNDRYMRSKRQRSSGRDYDCHRQSKRRRDEGYGGIHEKYHNTNRSRRSRDRF